MVSSIVNFVDTTTKRVTPDYARITGLPNAIFTPLHYVHRLWRWYSKGEVYSNPENFVGLLSGHLLNFFIGDNLVVRIAAQCVFIATRILECVQQQIVVCETYKKLIEAIKGTYAYHPPFRWIKESEVSFPGNLLSASTINCIRLKVVTLVARIQRVVLYALRLLKELFFLSMRVMDAVESFSLSPTTRNESVNEFFINGTRCLDILVDNKQRLLSAMKDNKEMIGSILQNFNPQYNVNELIAGVSKTMKVVESVHWGIKAVTSFGGGVLVKGLNHGVFNFFSAIGLPELAPNFLEVKADTSFEEHLAEPKPLTAQENYARRLAKPRVDWPISAESRALIKGNVTFSLDESLDD